MATPADKAMHNNVAIFPGPGRILRLSLIVSPPFSLPSWQHTALTIHSVKTEIKHGIGMPGHLTLTVTI